VLGQDDAGCHRALCDQTAAAAGSLGRLSTKAPLQTSLRYVVALKRAKEAVWLE
jgi:hypothetical protein